MYFCFQNRTCLNRYGKSRNNIDAMFHVDVMTDVNVYKQALYLISCRYNPGASCSKLTTSLVNVSLKFQTQILQIQYDFLLKKCESLLQYSQIFSKKKNNSVFDNVVSTYLTS